METANGARGCPLAAPRRGRGRGRAGRRPRRRRPSAGLEWGAVRAASAEPGARGRGHDPHAGLLQLLERRGVPRRVEGRAPARPGPAHLRRRRGLRGALRERALPRLRRAHLLRRLQVRGGVRAGQVQRRRRLHALRQHDLRGRVQGRPRVRLWPADLPRRLPRGAAQRGLLREQPAAAAREVPGRDPEGPERLQVRAQPHGVRAARAASRPRCRGGCGSRARRGHPGALSRRPQRWRRRPPCPMPGSGTQGSGTGRVGPEPPRPGAGPGPAGSWLDHVPAPASGRCPLQRAGGPQRELQGSRGGHGARAPRSAWGPQLRSHPTRSLCSAPRAPRVPLPPAQGSRHPGGAARPPRALLCPCLALPPARPQLSKARCQTAAPLLSAAARGRGHGQGRRHPRGCGYGHGRRNRHGRGQTWARMWVQARMWARTQAQR